MITFSTATYKDQKLNIPMGSRYQMIDGVAFTEDGKQIDIIETEAPIRDLEIAMIEQLAQSAFASTKILVDSTRLVGVQAKLDGLSEDADEIDLNTKQVKLLAKAFEALGETKKRPVGWLRYCGALILQLAGPVSEPDD